MALTMTVGWCKEKTTEESMGLALKSLHLACWGRELLAGPDWVE